MNRSMNHGRRGEFDPHSMESLQLSQAISNAHLKLMKAEKRDAMMQIGNVESSYRHRKLSLKDYGLGPQRHVAVLLVPPADQVNQAFINRIIIDVPTIPRNKASETLLDMYRANVERNAPELFDAYNVVDLSNSLYVPTRDIFGEAFNADGESIKFLLSPTGLHAYELPEDITPADPQLIAAGQQYVVTEGLGTYEAQIRLMGQWFDSSSTLGSMIRAYDPVLFEGSNGTAGSSVA